MSGSRTLYGGFFKSCAYLKLGGRLVGDKSLPSIRNIGNANKVLVKCEITIDIQSEKLKPRAHN